MKILVNIDNVAGDYCGTCRFKSGYKPKFECKVFRKRLITVTNGRSQYTLRCSRCFRAEAKCLNA